MSCCCCCCCCCCCTTCTLHLQELLLLLDEYWGRHPQLQGIPIYQASGVARKALNVFATYVAMMNQDIQKAIQVGGAAAQH
jgi:cleavage and polyadenylation specificity factor subunit 3